MNTDKIQYKYSDKCFDISKDITQKYFNFVEYYEELFFKDKFVLSIKDSNELSIQELTNLFVSLYDVDSNAAYLLLIKRIKDYVKNNFLLLKAKNMQDIVDPIDYDNIIEFIRDRVQDFVNQFELPIAFDYKINDNIIIANDEEEDSLNGTGFQYLNEENFPKLASEVLKRLDVFQSLLKTYDLLSLQQIDFTPKRYAALKEAIQTVKFSKVIRVDIDKIIESLYQNDTNDYDDIFSEGYIKYVATLLEATYFVCDYMYDRNMAKTTKVFHKNLRPYMQNIIENLSVYFDSIVCLDNINFINLYIKMKNESLKYTQDSILDNFKNRK